LIDRQDYIIYRLLINRQVNEEMLLLALLFLAFDQAEAIPTQGLSVSNQTPGNSTFQGTSPGPIFVKPAWVPGPSTRGTFGLVFSCVITLSLCVWTTQNQSLEHVASHLDNVSVLLQWQTGPSHGDKRGSRFGVRRRVLSSIQAGR